MHNKFALLIVILLAGPALASPAVIGTAVNQSGEQLYTEHHFTNADGFTEKVTYQANDKTFAEKILQPGNEPSSPHVLLKDSRSGQFYSVKTQNDNVHFRFQQNHDSELQKGTTPIEKPLIIDAGFDAFIQKNWQALTSGKKLTVYYALPSRQSLAKLTVAQDKNCVQDFCFTIAVKNWFLAIIIDSLSLKYNQQKQLLAFKGPSNIVDANGETLNVTINYQYPAQ